MAICFEPVLGVATTARAVVAEPVPSVVGFVRIATMGRFIARTVGSHLEAADVVTVTTRKDERLAGEPKAILVNISQLTGVPLAQSNDRWEFQIPTAE